MKVKHEKENTCFEYDKFPHKCLEGCNVSFTNIKTLRHHLEKEHKIIAEQEIQEFSTSEGNYFL